MEGQSSAKGAPKISKDEDETDEEQRRLGKCLQQVLMNPLVSWFTGQSLTCCLMTSRVFLSLTDMKAASQVNPQFLQAMRGTRRFVQEAVLAITDKNAQKSTLEKMEYSWRGVRINVTDSSDILDDLPRVLQSAQFVCIGALPGKIKNVRRVKDPTAARLLTTVLDSTPALSYLQIGIHFLLLDIDLRTVLSSPAVQTLANLSRLEILKKMEYEGPNYIAWLQNNEDADEEKNSFERNFCLLTELPNRLRTFDLPKKFPATWMKDSANQSVLRLLRNNTPTMEQLSLHSEVWSLQELGTLTFPVLKTLSANVYKEEEARTLAKFLENQKRSLEELTVESAVLHESLVTSIRARCMELRKLDLTSVLLRGRDVEEWSFLGSMNRLEEFRLRILIVSEVEEDGVTNGGRLLAFLPKNQLGRLSLEGISTESGLWCANGVEPELAVKTELLEGFRCLRKLSFMGSLDAVDDQLMQWLLKEFVSLEELDISKCSTLTDAGISGKLTAEWGRDASFADLPRLKTLKIVRCRGLTPNGVRESCVNVPCLRSLEYSNRLEPIEESVVMKLVEQNPRLERLILDYRGDIDVGGFGKLQTKVMKKNPRVKLSLAEEEDDELSDYFPPAVEGQIGYP